MNRLVFFGCLCFLLDPLGALGQTIPRKTIPATRAAERPKIDGALDDAVWATAPKATDFVMFEPANGGAIPRAFQTVVRVLYDDQAIYIGAMMYDPHSDSILRQMTERDEFNQNTDWLGFFINPYNDGLSDFNFWVTAAGTQADSKTTPNGDDFSLNSIWKSAVSITDSGWIMEAEIPYIALRFPETPVKDWGLNFMRSIRRSRKTSTWNFLDKSLGYRFEYQCGLITGISGIEPPVRLSATPYLSSYVDYFDGNSSYDVKAGLDLKYGINESFTLDMTLVPDFGQVAFDQQFLNLSPFENQFDENRQFFVEGTDLFNIGDLLYTRRIGGQPKNIRGQDLNSNDSVTIRQEYTRLLNATKVSGRTKDNLGIGFLNALTDDNYSTRIEGGKETRLLTEPMTNYNVIVLDQRFNRNSSIGFVNTNTLRKGADRDANVAALVGRFNTKSGKYFFNSDVKQSAIFEDGRVDDGYYVENAVGDVDGNWRWSVANTIITDRFDINDLGFIRRNNQIGSYGSLVFQTIQPFGKFNRMETEVYLGYEHLYKPFRYEDLFAFYRIFFLTRSFFAFGGNVTARPIATYDYFEPRAVGRWLKNPAGFESSFFISSDYRKVLALDARAGYDRTGGFDRDVIWGMLSPRIRLGDHFFMLPELIVTQWLNDYGFVPDTLPDVVYFGRRNNLSIETILRARYVFTPTSALSLSLRHSYFDVDYQDFYLLEQSGDLTPAELSGVNDLNFNTFNVDVKFSWWFAPASELVLLYRNVIASVDNSVGESYLVNLEQTFNSPMQNNFSIRLTYFLDYNRTRNYFKDRANR
ncbi:MAG: DUF5916 domain-containing protein [Cryomorphaceae bacterium]